MAALIVSLPTLLLVAEVLIDDRSGLPTMPVALAPWLALPFAVTVAGTLFRKLPCHVAYPYFEQRFGRSARVALALLPLLLQTAVAGVVLAAVAASLDLGTDAPHRWLAVIVLCVVAATAVSVWTARRGLPVCLWCAVVFGSAALVIALLAVWSTVEGGPTAIATMAAQYGYASGWPDLQTSGDILQCLAAIASFALLLMYLAAFDGTVVRAMTARSKAGHWPVAWIGGAVVFGLLAAVANHLGAGILVACQDQPDRFLRFAWVVRTDSSSNAEQRIATHVEATPDVVASLVADRIVLDPNTGRPFTDVREFTHADGSLSIDRLSTRLVNGERLLFRGHDEVAAYFVRHALSPLPLAAFAVGMFLLITAWLAEQIRSLTTLALSDVLAGLGLVPESIGSPPQTRSSKTASAIEGVLEPAVATIIGIAVLGVAVVVFLTWSNPWPIIWTLLAILVGPSIGLMATALSFARLTGGPAVAALLIGAISGLMLGFAPRLAEATGIAWLGLGLGAEPIGDVWMLPATTLITVAAGVLLGAAFGRSPQPTALQGLVIGRGPLGEQRPTIAPTSPDHAGSGPHGEATTSPPDSDRVRPRGEPSPWRDSVDWDDGETLR